MREPSLIDFAALLLRRRAWLMGGFMAGALIGVAVAFLIRPIYSVEVVVAPVTQPDGLEKLTGAVGGLSGLTSLLGVTLPGQRNSDQALAILKSRDFTARYIRDLNLLPQLFPEKWDADSGKWRTPAGAEPTLAQAVQRFQRRVRSVAEDRRTGIITISLTWYQREQLAGWANALVTRVNDELRAKTIEESERSLEHISAQLAKADQLELRESLFKLSESHIKAITLAKVRQDFAFQVIDPAVTPEKRDRVRPQRALTVLGGAVAGMVIALLASLLPGLWRNVRSRAAE